MHIMTEDGWQPLSVFCVNSNDLKGVYRPEPIEEAQKYLSGRADRFAFALDDGQTGDRCGNFSEPVFGAFGEKL